MKIPTVLMAVLAMLLSAAAGAQSAFDSIDLSRQPEEKAAPAQTITSGELMGEMYQWNAAEKRRKAREQAEREALARAEAEREAWEEAERQAEEAERQARARRQQQENIDNAFEALRLGLELYGTYQQSK